MNKIIVLGHCSILVDYLLSINRENLLVEWINSLSKRNKIIQHLYSLHIRSIKEGTESVRLKNLLKELANKHHTTLQDSFVSLLTTNQTELF